VPGGSNRVGALLGPHAHRRESPNARPNPDRWMPSLEGTEVTAQHRSRIGCRALLARGTVAPAEPRHDHEEDYVCNRATDQHCSDDVPALAPLAERESSERTGGDNRRHSIRQSPGEPQLPSLRSGLHA